ncbi:MAG: hypothetical protein RLZZ546_1111, partial [Bacteroidota bacterium]
MKQLLTIFLGIVFSVVGFGQKVNVKKMPINSAEDDFAPVYYKNGIAISSNRKTELFKNYLEID